MFFRAKKVRSGDQVYEYLQLVTSERVDGRVRQRVLASLGRLDKLRAEGAIDRLADSLGRFTETVTVLDALRDGAVVVESCPEWGASLVFDRIWKNVGLADELNKLARNRGFGFDVERTCFAIALQRLVGPRAGSDRAGARWLPDIRIEGLNDGAQPVEPQLQHFYRSVAFLAEHKETIETALYCRGRDLFNRPVDVALFDTTSLYFEGEGPEELAARGHSKDGKPQCKQVVLGVVMSSDGRPLCTELWPGNTADAKTVVPVLDALKRRFAIRHVVVVTDRGMVSKANLEAISEAGYDYIVGCKLRSDKTVRDQVLARAGRYHEVRPNLRVKQVNVDGVRYIVCHNPAEQERDRHKREAIIATLRDKIVGRTPKKLISNRGYRRFVKVEPGAGMQIDEDKLTRDARYDGKYVLRTTTDWDAADVALAYKSLWAVERLFRDFKGPLRTRPIYHRNADMVRGHVVGCFLGLYLAVELRKALDGLGDKAAEVEWDALLGDLSALKAITLVLKGRRYLVRNELRGDDWLGFRAAGLKVPTRVQLLEAPT